MYAYLRIRDVCIEHINHLREGGRERNALTLEYKCYTIFFKKFIRTILTFTFIELSFINYIFFKKLKLCQLQKTKMTKFGLKIAKLLS